MKPHRALAPIASFLQKTRLTTCGFLLGTIVAGGGPALAASNLVSLYTFDNTANNAVSGAPNGTLKGNGTDTPPAVSNPLPQYIDSVAGAPVGSGALRFDKVDDRVDLGTGGIPNSGSAFVTGSASLWFNITTKSNAVNTVLAGLNDANEFGNGATAFQLQINPYNGTGIETVRLYTRSEDSLEFISTTNVSSGIAGGTWHHLVVTWNLTTGTAGTGSAAFFLDGVALSANTKANNIQTAYFQAWDNPMRIGVASRAESTLIPFGTSGGSSKYWFGGSLDDVGIWDARLDATQAKALYNLALNDLDYNAKDASTLFDLFAAGQGTKVTSDGQRWGYVTGLTGSAGDIVDVGGHKALILDGSGNGVGQVVPEPATAMLFLLGSLLALPRHGRKSA